MSDNPFQADVSDSDPSFDEPVKKAEYSASKQSKLERLKAREAELLKRQSELDNLRSEVLPTPNFPSFYPVVIFNLDRDIPQSAHAAVSKSLYGLIIATVMSVFNIFAILSVTGLSNYKRVKALPFGVIQGFATVYLLMTQSYNKLYTGCRKKDIPFSWTIIQFALIAWSIYLTIGFPTSGSVGLATLLDLIAKSKNGFSIFMGFVNTALCGANTYFQFTTLYSAQAYQKVSGNTNTIEEKINDLQNEL